MPRFLTLAVIAALSTPVTLEQAAPAPQKVNVDAKKQESKAQALADAEFLMKVADAGMREVEIGRVAIEKASNSDVRAFARRLVTDHWISNEEVVKLAASKNVTLGINPASAMQVDNPLATKADHGSHGSSANLRTLEGAAFDRAYVDQMVKDHEEALALFDVQADESKDKDVKEWTEKKLEALKDHLKLGKDLQLKISG